MAAMDHDWKPPKTPPKPRTRPATPAAAASWPFTITFFHMGQGDAALIRCPDGEIVMVDCGSAKGFDTDVELRAVLELRKQTKGRPLHALILTHADKDHYNQVSRVLTGRDMIGTHAFEFDGTKTKLPYHPEPVDVQTIYYSDFAYRAAQSSTRATMEYVARLDRGPLCQYTEGAANQTLYHRLVKKGGLRLVQLEGKDTDHVRAWDKWDVSAVVNKSRQRPPNDPKNKQETVHRGSLAGVAWDVSIIAGNVKKGAKDASDADGCNAASLVTIIRWGSWKALICGDATVSTEAALLARADKAVDRLNLLQAPHHGSALTSSQAAFVKRAKPRAVVISVERLESGFHLPGRSVIEGYAPAAEQTPGDLHVIDGWRLSAGYVVGTENKAHRVVDGWVADLKVKPAADGSYTLTDEEAEDALNAADGDEFPVSAQPRTGFILMRQAIDREIWSTGLEGYDPFIVYTVGT